MGSWIKLWIIWTQTIRNLQKIQNWKPWTAIWNRSSPQALWMMISHWNRKIRTYWRITKSNHISWVVKNVGFFISRFTFFYQLYLIIKWTDAYHCLYFWCDQSWQLPWMRFQIRVLMFNNWVWNKLFCLTIKGFSVGSKGLNAHFILFPN